MSGAAQRSYRQTTKEFNRCRRFIPKGTAWNTLRDSARACGTKVINFLEKKSETILKNHKFTQDGLPEANCIVITQAKKKSPVQLDSIIVSITKESVCQDMLQKGLADKLIEDVRSKSHQTVYENPADTVQIHVDDVVVKKQKEHRCHQKNGRQVPNPKADKKRPKVQNTVARTPHNTKGFTLTGNSVFQVWIEVLGFLLNNDLIALRLLFFTDGQRKKARYHCQLWLEASFSLINSGLVPGKLRSLKLN